MRLVSVVAASVCFTFIALLFRRELTRPDRQRISWAPFAWMFIAGSRFVSAWLNLRAPGGVDAYSEGSPVDRASFFVLIGWGLVVLARRKIEWGRLFANNKWLLAYLLYCLVSVTWTDAPDVLVKRWIKDLGNPIMALILLTERRPYDALVTTIRRLAILFVPLSALFIKYYPELGRAYSYGGFASYTGVADQKNTLGLSCLIIGIAYGWNHLLNKRRAASWEIVLLLLWAWVMYMANSQTSLICLILTAALFVCARFPAVARQPTRIIVVTTTVVCLYMAADSLFHIQDDLLGALGRDDTFTNRTTVWEAIRPLQTNAWIGIGFMTFWNGDRMETIWATVGRGINQAHNGYLEQYLNLGYVGVAFIIGLVVVTLLVLRRHLKTDYPVAILRLGLVIVALVYNYTEASFYGVNNMWVLFLAACINVPAARSAEVAHAASTPLTGRARFQARARSRPAPVYGHAAAADVASPTTAWMPGVEAGGPVPGRAQSRSEDNVPRFRRRRR